MTKVSIAELETLRRNPSEFANSILGSNTSKNTFGGQAKSMRWLSAVCDYHQSGSIIHASDRLEESFRKRKDTRKNRLEVEQLTKSLGIYQKTLQKEGYVNLRQRERIDLKLNTLDITIGGWIHLIMMRPSGGFASFFVGRYDEQWENQLKYKITQWYVATELFKTSLSEVSVGMIDFPSGAFYLTTYSDAQISTAVSETRNLIETLHSYLEDGSSPDPVV